MLDFEGVIGDEERNGIQGVFGMLGEGVRFAYQTADLGELDAKPTLYMAGFAFASEAEQRWVLTGKTAA